MSAFDFSTGAFNAARHYSSVSMQQGQVQLDADSSEDSEANSEKIRRLVADTTLPDADSAPSGEAASGTLSGALAGFEPAGGLHPLANALDVA